VDIFAILIGWRRNHVEYVVNVEVPILRFRCGKRYGGSTEGAPGLD
jgi:hypothetical protein